MRPDEGHELGKTRELAVEFFVDILTRKAESQPSPACDFTTRTARAPKPHEK